MMIETKYVALRRGLAAAVVAAAVVLPGCAETEITGEILLDDVDTPDLMIGLARGMESEFEDPWVASAVFFTYDAMSDQLTNDNLGDEEEVSGNYVGRPNDGGWGQFHEASWAAIFAYEKMKDVYPAETFESSPLAARVMLLGGMAERFLGEMYCELIYNYGLEGGVLLPQGEAGPYDPSQLVPRDSAFKRAIAMHEIALEHAEAAIAANAEVPEDDPLFDPVDTRYGALGGLAQAYANLGDWDTAVEYARQVPDNFAIYAYANSTVDGGLDMADEMWNNDDTMSLYGTQGAELWADDPRLGLVKCGEWRPEYAHFADDPTIPLYQRLDGTVSNSGTTWFINRGGACGHADDEYRSESNRYPLYISTKIEDDNTDIEIVSGAEMRLIEAEAALRNGDLVEFKAQVDRARAVRGLGPIAQPAQAGALEFPNAEDDAWSILDRERYLELFLEGRRFWDLGRWNHPYLTGDHVNLARFREFMAPGGRMSCPDMGHPAGSGWGYPIPEQECSSNPLITCAPLAGG